MKGGGAGLTPRRRPRRGKAEAGSEPSFYEAALHPGEVRDLEAAMATGLDHEIALLRIVMRRVFATASLEPEMEAAGLQQLLNSMGLAAIRLGNLLRVQQQMGGAGNEAAAAIAEAISQVAEEMGLGERYGSDK
jgi:hypothetical protein